MALHKVKIKQFSITVDLKGDHYSSEFWDKISSRTYEPDTIGFIEDRCDRNSDFLDIGAANGAMTLIAASNGSRVSAYEPDPRIYSVALRNIQLNKELQPMIQLQNKAISSYSGTLNFLNGEDPSVLTPIVFTNHDSNSSIGIEILPLASEIERFHKDKRRKLIVKMDIEGAEWRILRSQSSVQSLCDNSAILLLAVHPGFYRPFVKRFRGFNRITLLVWDFRNYWESLLVFKHLSGVAIIRRTNLNLVHHKHQFAALIMAGYHEFIIEFQPS